MKRRHRSLFNLFAAALLAFSLYLNFIKKDAPETAPPHRYAKTPSGVLNEKETPKTTPVKKDTGAVVASK